MVDTPAIDVALEFIDLRASDVVPTARAVLNEYAFELNAVEDDLSDPTAVLTWESVMDRLEIIDDPVSRFCGALNHHMLVANTPDMRTAHAEIHPEILAVQSRRAQSVPVLRAMQFLQNSPDFDTVYTAEQQRLLDRAIVNATLKGAALTDNDKATFNAISVRLKALERKFNENVLDATAAFSCVVTDKTDLAGVGDSTLAQLAQNAVAGGVGGATADLGPWMLSLDQSSYKSLMQQCTHRSTREMLFRAVTSIASADPFDNTLVMQEILQLRHRLANLLSFHSFAEMTMTTKMAPSVQVVEDMLDELRDACMPLCETAMAELTVYAIAHGHPSNVLEGWDQEYWSEAMRRYRFAVDNEAVKPYFPFPQVLNGLFDLVSRLFGIKIEELPEKIELWHPDVRVFQIRSTDEPDEPVVARFFLDAYSRPGKKREGAWCAMLVTRSKALRPANAPVRLPVFSLSDNQPPAVGDTPSLMTLGDIQGLFQGFGHGLRHALSMAEYAASTAIDGIEWDAIELPSLFLSSFCKRRDTIAALSGHYATSAPLPDHVLDKLLAQRQFAAPVELLRQLRFAATDLAVHYRYDPFGPVDALAVQNLIAQTYAVPPFLADDKFLCTFTHIFSSTYAAGYYSYIWSELLSADTFACFDKAANDHEWQQAGRRFRDTVLAKLGVVHPLEAYRMFRGRRASADALMQRYGLQ